MWPHEIANGKWLLYPMRVELEGGQGPGKKGICSPRPNILRLVRLRQGRQGRRWERCHAAWVGVLCVGGGEGDAILGLHLRGDPHCSFLFPVQDVDSRDRRPRELEQPEPQEPPEKLEPSSTSWWPVSSAERKRNVTLVRAA